eukprot:TRINITY_DN9392_c0_g1_i1.p2 TRINITY_DN9392_c0_g1~~TRINITY_DN9392_c0_g1_i1.p2  ORF type:complete len:104 (-),score=4.59 TRINITY_DN9392_c0_g1_i1:129-440(-)
MSKESMQMCHRVGKDCILQKLQQAHLLLDQPTYVSKQMAQSLRTSVLDTRVLDFRLSETCRDDCSCSTKHLSLHDEVLDNRGKVAVGTGSSSMFMSTKLDNIC